GRKQDASEGLIDVTGDRRRLVEHEAVMNQRRHATEGIKREISVGDWLVEGIDLDVGPVEILLDQRHRGDAQIDAVAIAVQFEDHAPQASPLTMPTKGSSRKACATSMP